MDPEEAAPERSRAPDQPAPAGPAATDGPARAGAATTGDQEPERHPAPDPERDGQPAARPEAAPPGGSGRVTVPPSLARAAAVSWRLLVVVAAAAVVLYLLVILRVVVIPVIVALFAASLLVPAANRLRRAGWPPLAATWAVFGAFLIVVIGIFVVFVPLIADQFGQIRTQAAGGVNEIRRYLAGVGIDNDDLQRYIEQAQRQFSSGGGGLTSGVISGARLVGEVIAGIIVALVMLFFFVKDSDAISRWLLDLVAPRYRADARAMSWRASTAISGYLRGVATVGFVDGFFIGLGLLLLGVPLAIPLAFLTFVGAFLPLVGAFVAGLLAALVALVSKGLLAALAVVAITIAVQQLEGHILAPLVLGRAVKLHPIVILLALGAGSILGGIAGAFLAVPVAATLAALAGYLRERNAGAAPAAAAQIDGDGGAREPPT
jgi:putative heme transporter